MARHISVRPLAAIFEEIYREKYWGGHEHDFYSGTGSHRSDLIEPFVAGVRSYLGALPVRPVVVDIGCGDFTASGRLVDLANHYHACDIVPALIARNRRLFAQPTVSFHLLDAVTDPLPPGDVVILKQVLQHLANHQIAKILRSLSGYSTWIVTEHLPSGAFTPNRDMAASGFTRLQQQSGVVLTEAPFNVRPDVTEILSEVVEDGHPVRTVAYRFSPHRT